MANVPISAQAILISTNGHAWWGNRAISPIPDDAAEPDELCCDSVLAQYDPEIPDAIKCAIEEFWQAMVTLHGTRDFIIITPIPEEDQPGYSRMTKSVDTSKPIRYEQPYYKQGLWDEEASRLECAARGKTSDDLLVVYFKVRDMMSESSVIKHLGYQFVITDFRLEPFGGVDFWRAVISKHEDRKYFLAYDSNPVDPLLEIEGRIFFSTESGGQGAVGNLYTLDPDNAKILVLSPTSTPLFEFGEDLSGFPVGSSYTNPDHAKWFRPAELEVRLENGANYIYVLDDAWMEWIKFDLNGNVISSEPSRRRR